MTEPSRLPIVSVSRCRFVRHFQGTVGSSGIFSSRFNEGWIDFAFVLRVRESAMSLFLRLDDKASQGGVRYYFFVSDSGEIFSLRLKK